MNNNFRRNSTPLNIRQKLRPQANHIQMCDILQDTDTGGVFSKMENFVRSFLWLPRNEPFGNRQLFSLSLFLPSSNCHASQFRQKKKCGQQSPPGTVARRMTFWTRTGKQSVSGCGLAIDLLRKQHVDVKLFVNVIFSLLKLENNFSVQHTK